jgi:hypothetical protein
VTLTPSRRERPRRRRWRIVLAVVAAGVAFAVGIALGQSLDDNPSTGRTQTLVRTLKPLDLPPAARETVTVTTSNP